MFADTTPRRIVFAGLLLVSGWLCAVPHARATAPDDAQRNAFRQAYAAAGQGGDGWRNLAAGLRDYPLYPYLQAAALQHDIQLTDRATVEAYLQQYPGWIPAADLRRAFLLELARREDWDGFRALYQPGLGDTLACHALRASLASGGTLDFERDLAALWAKPNLPSACDPVLTAAHDQGLLTDARLWSRIDRATDAGQGGTVASLADWLSGSDRDDAKQLALALRDPAAALAEAASWPDNVRQREATTLALVRLARRQTASADAAWQKLQSRFSFSPAQRERILQTLALYHATDFDERALARLRALPAAAQTDSTREWRVRVALARQDWSEVLAGIDAMSPEQRQDGEWQYFRGRALAELGRDDEARQQLDAQAGKTNFFGFLAAERLGRPYVICPSTLAADPQREQALLGMPGLLRAFELFAVDLPAMARREWARALQGADAATVRVAADMANRRGWYDRAVFAMSSGEALRLYDLRFPLASQDGLVPQAEQAGIEPAWAYGILRAESAWMSDARSAADARGLMQLLPATAAQVARRNGFAWSGAESLYDPVVNVALGTRYLAQMAARFDGSPWLASAAYNAGPNKVGQWLAARGTLSPELFVATIPYKETREYVARVMAFSVIYDWRLSGSTVVPVAARLNPIGQPYGQPDAATERRAIVCPAAPPANMSATGSKSP